MSTEINSETGDVDATATHTLTTTIDESVPETLRSGSH